MFLFGKKLDKQCVEESCNDEFIDVRNKEELKDRTEKPPNLREIGAATWLYLHSMANKYPENPNSSDKQVRMHCAFDHTISLLYSLLIIRDIKTGFMNSLVFTHAKFVEME
ncbi:Erv1 Alr family [Cryptosporidium sp. chipmunk genotype I]|uniref:Erv1 Alr family n=1 Tax=Cryptosporidium sp. chipmunk genotype I TaxID=1280935 RepID=UPI00351A184C|nr:Erv1 Alr family [Cryptosporidium sp. chipmunk genotype I]